MWVRAPPGAWMAAAIFSDPATNLLDRLDATIADHGAGGALLTIVPFKPAPADVELRLRDRAWGASAVGARTLAALGDVADPAALARADDDDCLAARFASPRLAALGAALEGGGPDPLATRRVAPGRRWTVNFGDPNTTKALHVGHLRNVAVGNALAGAAEALGMQVTRQSRVGDFGRNMGEAMAGYLRHGDGRRPERDGVKGDHLIGDCYLRYVRDQAAAARRRTRPRATRRSRASARCGATTAEELLARWRDGDPRTRRLFDEIRSWVTGGHDADLRAARRARRPHAVRVRLPRPRRGARRARARAGRARARPERRDDVPDRRAVLPAPADAPARRLPDPAPALCRHLRRDAAAARRHPLDSRLRERVAWAHTLRRGDPAAAAPRRGDPPDGQPDARDGRRRGRRRRQVEQGRRAARRRAARPAVRGRPARRARRGATTAASRTARARRAARLLPRPPAAGSACRSTLDELLDPRGNVGWPLAQAWARAWDPRHDGAPDPEPADADYRFLLVQSQRHRRLLAKQAQKLDLLPFVRFHYHLSRWYGGVQTTPRLARAMRSVLGCGLGALGLARVGAPAGATLAEAA